MSDTATLLDAGCLLPPKSKVDKDATEQIVARSYRHAALGDRQVVRLASDRLGQAEDLAMEFLGFDAPDVTKPIAVQQRRSLGFAAWALINDPDNAHFALDLVKRMKAAARKARSKPGHAWDAYADLAKELGRGARHFLPAFWEEAGRTFKDLGNQTYAGRALNKSLEAERVHALESDRARRRDVVLEFVLSGCLAGKALSDYAGDLLDQYEPEEAFKIFRDLCVRRTRGGMAPWAAMPKDFMKIAKAADLDANKELENWLEEVIDAPAMGRAANQFWKGCSKHCQRLVARNSKFAVALLRHTKPEQRYYGESKLGPWLDLLDEWGVFPFIWDENHRDAPPLGEPMAVWFGRIARDDCPAPTRVLELLQQLAPRLKREKTPLPLSLADRYGTSEIDIDVLEACLVLGVTVDDPPKECSVTFNGWLAAEPDHELRNQDIVKSWQDERFKAAIFSAMSEALACRGGSHSRGWRQADLEQRAFPLAADERPGIKELWHLHTSGVLEALEGSGLASFESALERLESTLWPDTLRLFPDLAERLAAINPNAMLQRTLQAGVVDEYGWPAFETLVDEEKIEVKYDHYRDSNIHLTFPDIALADGVHAHIARSDGTLEKKELHLPKIANNVSITIVGDDLAVNYRDNKWDGHFHWVSNPAESFSCGYSYGSDNTRRATKVDDGVFLGHRITRSGEKDLPGSSDYIHDGERFWQFKTEWNEETDEYRSSVAEIDPQTGKASRTSVPAWFENEEGEIEWGLCELMSAPAGSEDSPLGVNDGMLGWKVSRRRDGSHLGEGIDGRRWDKPLEEDTGIQETPIALLRQPGTDKYLPVTTRGTGRIGFYWIWDPTGTTIVAKVEDFDQQFAYGQVALLPIHFWHLWKVRDEGSSKKLRKIDESQCEKLMTAAEEDRNNGQSTRRAKKASDEQITIDASQAAIEKFLPKAPARLVKGLAYLIRRAEQQSAQFLALREKSTSESQKTPSRSSLVINRKIDDAVKAWALPGYSFYGADRDNVSISAHLAEAAAFFKGESPGGDLPRTSHLWFGMLDGLPMQCWQTFWRVTADKMSSKDGAEQPWVEFLEHWVELGIAGLPGSLTVMAGHPEGVKKRTYGSYDVDVEGGTSFTLQQGDDLFIVIEDDGYNDYPHHFLRYSTADEPGTPSGFQIKRSKKVKSESHAEQIQEFLAAVKAAEELPLPTQDELAQTAQTLASSPAEIGLIWMGGVNLDNYENNFLPADLRKALGWKVTEANAGRQSIRNLKESVVNRLYESVIATGLAAPFADDRAPVLASIEKTWQSKMPKRLPLDAALQKRLSALGKTSRWHRTDHEELLSIAAEPTKHAELQPRDIEIQLEKSRNYRSITLGAKKKSESPVGHDTLQSIVHLVAMVHGETPIGHEARKHMPPLIKQVTKLINSPKIMLPLRDFYLHEYGNRKVLKPAEWINKHIGKTKTNKKDKLHRFDDELVSAAAVDGQSEVLIAFRPAKLRDDSDMSRLVGLQAIEISQEWDGNSAFVPLIGLIKSPGFQKLAASILADGPDGAWPQNPVHTAPEVVAKVQKKTKLGDDAATLYCQLLALPDCTTANVRKWNDWTAAQVKKAAGELVKKKLVLEAKRARAGRNVFLPGEWLELKTPWLPIERWKLSHLSEIDFALNVLHPAGGPLVLRPFDELFLAAWQRVLDGDEPKYEEVKRKRTAKKTTKKKGAK